ncbi:MAG: rSAM/selenodomain-associated transferase 2 [Patiriisocius sp.]|jgi:rSAM/selenodomain-associated transferase 2
MFTHMISIIIPVLNEASTITELLTHLNQKGKASNISEISIVDGGSKDATLALVTKFAKTSKIPIQVLSSERGRAKQMNMGAKASQGTILYFLHADSFPPQDFDTLIISEVKKQNLAGCFKMKFDSNHWWLRLAGWLTHFKWRACRGGDQSQFITKELFNDIGGFDESYIIYEDNILINELYKRKEFIVIQEWIDTSARLYRKKGVWTLQYHFWTIYVKKWLGADSDTLYTYYKKHIAA